MKRSARLSIVSLLLTCAMLMVPIGAMAAGPSLFTSYISGFVFLDLDEDGARSAVEPGIEGVEVRLMQGLVELDVDYTNSDGLFQFTPGTMGLYTLVEIVPPGYKSTTRESQEVFYYPGYANTTLFGVVALEERGVQALVYDDADRSRSHDAGESGLPGAQLTLMDGQGAELSRGTTSDEGEFTFDSLEPGEYILLETDPEGYFSTTSNERALTLSEADGLISVEFGDFLPAEGEIGAHDVELTEYFGLPLLDVLELRAGRGWGYGEIARALYLAHESEASLEDILAMRAAGDGWGEISKALLGEAGLKGFNLGRIISGREETDAAAETAKPADVAAAESCGLAVESYMELVSVHGQGLVKRACKLYRSQTPAGFRSPAEIIFLLQSMTLKEVKEMLQQPTVPYGLGESASGGGGKIHSGNGNSSQSSSGGQGPKACKGKNKDQPGC